MIFKLIKSIPGGAHEDSISLVRKILMFSRRFSPKANDWLLPFPEPQNNGCLFVKLRVIRQSSQNVCLYRFWELQRLPKMRKKKKGAHLWGTCCLQKLLQSMNWWDSVSVGESQRLCLFICRDSDLWWTLSSDACSLSSTGSENIKPSFMFMQKSDPRVACYHTVM